jgi:hypothetical protein
MKPVIFLAFANDRLDQARYLRNLPLEHDQLREALRPAEQLGLCEVVERANASTKHLFDVFQDRRYRDRIAVFHYGGHADGYQLLLEQGTAHGGGLVAFLARQKGLQLVFFNGCTTQQQAQELAQAGVPAVVGTYSAIGDEVATALATRFYLGVGQQLPLRQAWDAAVDELRARVGDHPRGMLRHGAETTPDFPWQWLATPAGEAWGLGAALHNRATAAQASLEQRIAATLDELAKERLTQLAKRLRQTRDLLAAYEEQLLLSDDPKTQMRAEREIERQQATIEKILTEMRELTNGQP